jgi:hypothetical protein
MMNLRETLTQAAASGSAAAMASAVVAARLAIDSGSSPYAPLNAVTHCLWQNSAFAQQRLSARYSGLGAIIHWGSSVFWGVLFETLRGERASPGRSISAAAATSAIAYFVDYHIVPKRVTPGFEAHIPARSFPLIYGALAIGFLLAATGRHDTARDDARG